MKTIISKILVLLVLALLFCSCSEAKKYQEQNTIVKSDIQKLDSTKVAQINKGIEDRLITPVLQSKTSNPVLDSLVNAKVDEILQKLNTSKTSGDNSYKLLYDKLTKQLEFYTKIGQTANEKTKVKQQSDKTIIQIKKVPVIIEKPLSRLERFLIGLGILSLVFISYKAFVFIRGKTKMLWV